MKITDPQVIRQGEKDLIDSVQEDLDLDAVRAILKERMSVASLSSKGGQIVVHDNKIAFRLDFEINLSGSLLFDREGNFIDKAPDWESGLDTQSDDIAPMIRERQDIDEDNLLEDDLPQEGMTEEDDLDLDHDTLADEDLDEEDLLVDSPDYGVEVDADASIGIEDNGDQDMDEIDRELELAREELAMDDLDEDEDEDFLDDDSMDLEDEDAEEDFQQIMDEEDDPFGDDDMEPQDLDDDINDILKESREFWEQKKDS